MRVGRTLLTRSCVRMTVCHGRVLAAANKGSAGVYPAGVSVWLWPHTRHPSRVLLQELRLARPWSAETGRALTTCAVALRCCQMPLAGTGSGCLRGRRVWTTCWRRVSKALVGGGCGENSSCFASSAALPSSPLFMAMLTGIDAAAYSDVGMWMETNASWELGHRIDFARRPVF